MLLKRCLSLVREQKMEKTKREPIYGWSTIKAADGDIHVCPKHGPDHEINHSCWCEPRLDYQSEETGAMVWIHKEVH